MLISDCLIFLTMCFPKTTVRKIAVAVRTIAPLGAIFIMKETIMPTITEQADTPQDMIAVFLNPLPIVIAVMFGSTMRDDMSNTPTNFIDAMTVTLAITMKR